MADLAGGLAVDVGMIVALSKVYGIPLTRSSAVKLVRDMMIALGAMGLVQVATRLVASGVKSAMAGLTIMTGGLAGPLTALGYGAIGLTQGGRGGVHLLRPRPRGQDLPPPGLPVGPEGHQDRDPAAPRPGQDRLGHRTPSRRPQEDGSRNEPSIV